MDIEIRFEKELNRSAAYAGDKVIGLCEYEIADITISEDDLYQLVVLRKISRGLMKRIDRNYRSIISFNMMLILLGVAGVIAPSTSALLHNMSTLAISVHSMTDVI